MSARIWTWPVRSVIADTAAIEPPPPRYLVKSILETRYSNLQFDITETPWVGSYKRICARYFRQCTYGRNIDIKIYLTQDGESKWTAATYLGGSPISLSGETPEIIRKFINKGILLERLTRADNTAETQNKARGE